MKKISFLLVLQFIAIANVTAQVFAQKVFSTQVTYYKMSNADYYISPVVANQISVYNASNHTLYNTITLPATITGYTSQGSCYLYSDNIFDSDNTIECWCAYKDGSDQYRFYLINEDGTNGMFIQDANYGYVKQTNDGAKMIVTKNIAAVLSTSIFAFNTTPVIPTGTTTAFRANPYPNPATEAIHLAYDLPAGEKGTLNIVDAVGSVVKTYSVGSDFESILVTTDDLVPGLYNYSVASPSGIQQGKSFVVQ